MKNPMIYIFLLLCMSCGKASKDEETVALPPDCSESNSERVSYTLTFAAAWSAATHPQDYPSNAHFSPLVGATHSSALKYWNVGQAATAGIKVMAETGGTGSFVNEIATSVSNKQACNSILAGSGIQTGTGSNSVTFYAIKEFPLLSIVSMIAPSPDWFVGVDSLLLYENEEWKDEISVDLFAYDSGTDSGLSYASANEETDPVGIISKFSGTAPPTEVSFGTFTIKKN